MMFLLLIIFGFIGILDKVNCYPVLSIPLDDGIAKTDENFELTISDNTFSSTDGKPLHMNISTSSTSDWLKIRKKSKKISEFDDTMYVYSFVYDEEKSLVFTAANTEMAVRNISDLYVTSFVSKIGGFVLSKWISRDGDWVYVSDEVGSDYFCFFINITDPKNPEISNNITFRGSSYRIFSLASGKDLLFIGGSLVISGYNVSDKMYPELLFSIGLQKYCKDIKVEFNYRNTSSDILFVAASQNGLLIYNITDLKNVSQISSLTTFYSSSIYLKIDEGRALVYALKNQNANSEFHIIDVSDLSNPFETTLYAFPSCPCCGGDPYPEKTVVVDNLAYVADYRCKLLVYDVSNPYAIVPYDSYEISRYFKVHQVDVAYLLLSTFAQGVHIYNINNHYELYGTPKPEDCGSQINVTVTSYDDDGNSLNETFSINVQHRYFGELCSICGGIDYNDSSVCSSRGNCTSRNLCECHQSNMYFGENCEVTTCFGVFSNDSSVCSAHGNCTWMDVCECQDYYYEKQCNVTVCSSLFSNDSLVCNQKGKCEFHNYCTCDEPNLWFGANCNTTSCGGVSSRDDSVCSSNGNCIEFDVCDCTTPYYFGKLCNVTTCYGYFGNDTLFHGCNNGTCVGYNNCSCFEGYYGDDCLLFDCHGVLYNDTENEVCYGHGSCIAPDTCVCVNDTIYYPSGKNGTCKNWKCYGKSRFETDEVCSNHGTCRDFQNCSCITDKWKGPECEFYSCWGRYTDQIDLICGSHGSCAEIDKCFCVTGYFSDGKPFGDCTRWYCYEFQNSDDNVCSSHGACTSPHQCACRDDFEGKECETWSCGFPQDDTERTCSGHGKCTAPAKCECTGGYQGDLCQTNGLLLSVMTPILSTFAIFVCFGFLLFMICVVIGCFCCVLLILLCFGIVGLLSCRNRIQKFRLQRFSKLKNVDLILKEQELEESTDTAHLKIRKDLFEIDYEKIQLLGILGEGGSESTVYKAKWSGKIIAFKCFKTSSLCADQTTFEEFEREVQILGSVLHPNILRFFGAALKPPRVGIVMEFCEKGDLEAYLKMHVKMKGKGVDLGNKIRILQEIASPLEYLHNRSIIHRDLKLLNVLVDKSETCKLMDFGLSKIVDRMSVHKTKRVGTSYYMAPELMTGKYDEKVDVFAYAITTYILLTEEYHPYGVNAMHGVENRVSNDPKYRPNLDRIRSCFQSSSTSSSERLISFFEDVMTKCWSHESKERPSFSEISKWLGEELPKIIEEESLDISKVFKTKKEEESDIMEERRVKEEESEDLKILRSEVWSEIEKFQNVLKFEEKSKVVKEAEMVRRLLDTKIIQNEMFQ